MKAQPAPLTHKLILLTLGLIFGCLAMIVVWLYAPNPGKADGEPTPSTANSLADTIRHRWSTNPANRGISTHASMARSGLSASPPREIPAVSGTGNDPSGLNSASPPASMALIDRSRIVAGAAVVRGQTVAIPTGDSGSIVGRVTLVGVPKPEIPIDFGPSCGPLRTEPATTRHYVVSPDGGLANVLVVVLPLPAEVREVRPGQLIARPGNYLEILSQLDPLIDSSARLSVYGPALSGSVLLDQRACMFEPYMVAMQGTQKLVVRNSDPLLHNQRFTPRRNREFNSGQPGLGPDSEFQFAKPEAFIRIKCDVHPWMFAYVSVLPHPFFALTDADGWYRIPAGLPAKSYALAAVHLKAGVIGSITVDPAGENRRDFQLTIAGGERGNSMVVRER